MKILFDLFVFMVFIKPNFISYYLFKSQQIFCCFLVGQKLATSFVGSQLCFFLQQVARCFFSRIAAVSFVSQQLLRQQVSSCVSVQVSLCFIGRFRYVLLLFQQVRYCFFSRLAAASLIGQLLFLQRVRCFFLEQVSFYFFNRLATVFLQLSSSDSLVRQLFFLYQVNYCFFSTLAAASLVNQLLLLQQISYRFFSR